MTKIASLVLALSLIVNEFTLLYNVQILKDKYLASNLVYLLSVCLLLRKVNIFPRVFWRKYSPICFLLEVITTVAILECSLTYVWKFVQDYVLRNADGLLVLLAEKQSLDWLVCHLCCARSDCPAVFAALVLRAVSFVLLMGSCMVSHG
ncbi:uncharacterized protein LOC114355962 [Ostrinia furnacalis]|uniref:uncharacterized protein LOC114355962 n=1 Tax=Ostrinia furnacalis TaxID=93504 RepID=UPI00103BB88F|nr:uncharacterized protein LOC114355962 [Ostrinia furnacalis]